MDVPIDYHVWNTMLGHYQRDIKKLANVMPRWRTVLLTTQNDLLHEFIDKNFVSFFNRFRSCVAEWAIGIWRWLPINRLLRQLLFMLVRGVDLTRICFARRLTRPLCANHLHGHPTLTRRLYCMMTSSPASSTRSSRLVALSVVHDRRTHGSMPTAGLPSVSPAVWSGLFWQLLTAPPLHLAVPLPPLRPPPLTWPRSRGTTRDVATVNFATGSVCRSGRINWRPVSYTHLTLPTIYSV